MTVQPENSFNSVLLPLHYLPNLEYFAYLGSFENCIIEGGEYYVRQTYRNRCTVLTTNKIDTLTVPVIKGRTKVLMRDVEIDYNQDWIRRHWGCITSAYAKSPYFEYYAPDFRQIYESRPQYLFDLNQQLLTLCLRFLRLKLDIQYTLSYQDTLPENVLDARNAFNNKNLATSAHFYEKKVYYQTFGNDFIDNLSVLDLLFNMGPDSLSVLKQSAPNWR